MKLKERMTTPSCSPLKCITFMDISFLPFLLLFQNLLRIWILGFWHQERVWLMPDIFHPTNSCSRHGGSRAGPDIFPSHKLMQQAWREQGRSRSIHLKSENSPSSADGHASMQTWITHLQYSSYFDAQNT